MNDEPEVPAQSSIAEEYKQRLLLRAKAGRPLNVDDVVAVMPRVELTAEVLAEVPVLAIPCALGAPEDAGDKGGSQAGWWGSVIPSVWSYCLAARSRGLGTAWTTLHLPYEHEVGEALGIPDTVTQLACIPTAYYTGDTFRPGARRPAEEVTYWNTWKNTDM